MIIKLIKVKILLIIIASSLYADPFFQQDDKQKHIVGSMAISGTATGIARHYGCTPMESFLIGVGTAMIVGIAKEEWDGQGYGTKDYNDLKADAIGAIGGSLISAQFSWKF